MFSDEQVSQLLKGIHPSRVKKDPSGKDYIEQWDCRAHLNRVFGFGNWDQQVTRLAMVFEEPTKSVDKQTGKPKPNRWDVCYSASVKVTVRAGSPKNEDNWMDSCDYEDAATGYAQNQTRGEAHDLALKSAVSTALKRACVNLGDNFGLSLYAGQTDPVVRGVLGWKAPEVKPEVKPEADA